MHASRQTSRDLLLRAKAAPLQARRHAFFNSLLGYSDFLFLRFLCRPPSQATARQVFAAIWSQIRPPDTVRLRSDQIDLTRKSGVGCHA